MWYPQQQMTGPAQHRQQLRDNKYTYMTTRCEAAAIHSWLQSCMGFWHPMGRQGLATRSRSTHPLGFTNFLVPLSLRQSCQTCTGIAVHARLHPTSSRSTSSSGLHAAAKHMEQHVQALQRFALSGSSTSSTVTAAAAAP
jgi:hypothetical protein